MILSIRRTERDLCTRVLFRFRRVREDEIIYIFASTPKVYFLTPFYRIARRMRTVISARGNSYRHYYNNNINNNHNTNANSRFRVTDVTSRKSTGTCTPGNRVKP